MIGPNGFAWRRGFLILATKRVMASKRRSALWSANQNPVVGDAVGRCAIGGPLRGNLDHRVNGLVLGPEQADGNRYDTLSRPVLKNDLLDNFGAVDYANSTKLACARIAAVGLVVGLFRRAWLSQCRFGINPAALRGLKTDAACL